MTSIIRTAGSIRNWQRESCHSKMGEYCRGKFQACKTALESPENYNKLDQHTEQIQMPARKYPVGLGFLPSGNVRRQARRKRSRMPFGPLLLFHFQVSPVFDHIILKCCKCNNLFEVTVDSSSVVVVAKSKFKESGSTSGYVDVQN